MSNKEIIGNIDMNYKQEGGVAMTRVADIAFSKKKIIAGAAIYKLLKTIYDLLNMSVEEIEKAVKELMIVVIQGVLHETFSDNIAEQIEALLPDKEKEVQEISCPISDELKKNNDKEGKEEKDGEAKEAVPTIDKETFFGYESYKLDKKQKDKLIL